MVKNSDLESKLEQVERNAEKEFLKAAHAAMRKLIKNGDEFTTDDVWAYLEAGKVTTRERRALGPVVRYYVEQHDIERVGYRKTARREAHCRPVSVWRPKSWIY